MMLMNQSCTSCRFLCGHDYPGCSCFSGHNNQIQTSLNFGKMCIPQQTRNFPVFLTPLCTKWVGNFESTWPLKLAIRIGGVGRSTWLLCYWSCRVQIQKPGCVWIWGCSSIQNRNWTQPQSSDPELGLDSELSLIQPKKERGRSVWVCPAVLIQAHLRWKKGQVPVSSKSSTSWPNGSAASSSWEEREAALKALYK